MKPSTQYVYSQVKKWRSNNPLAWFAQQRVYVALRSGKIIKGVCFCGNTKTEAHHEDYSKPLEIQWLCKKHHIQADKLRRGKEKTLKSYTQKNLIVI